MALDVSASADLIAIQPERTGSQGRPDRAKRSEPRSGALDRPGAEAMNDASGALRRIRVGDGCHAAPRVTQSAAVMASVPARLLGAARSDRDASEPGVAFAVFSGRGRRLRSLGSFGL
jgi:hypothetical protein